MLVGLPSLGDEVAQASVERSGRGGNLSEPQQVKVESPGEIQSRMVHGPVLTPEHCFWSTVRQAQKLEGSV